MLFNKMTVLLLTVAMAGTSASTSNATPKGHRALTSEPFVCITAQDCKQCVENECAWAGGTGGTCHDSCLDIADVACYSSSDINALQFQNDSDAICKAAQREQENWATCATKPNCGACTSTMLLNNNPGGEDNQQQSCYWHSEVQACKPIPFDAFTAGADRCFSTPQEEHCYFARVDCISCVHSGCGWTGEDCIPSCDDLADGGCIGTETIEQGTIEEMCYAAEIEHGDRNVCSVQTDCQECTDTYKFGLEETCQWYTDKVSGLGWCGTGECDANGNCGSTTCAAPGGIRGAGKAQP